MQQNEAAQRKSGRISNMLNGFQIDRWEGPVWQACKKWHGTGSVKQYVNMIWFELCWSWIHLGYYFIYNRSSAYQDYCSRMDLNDYSIYITEIQLPPTYTGHSLFQSKQLGRFVANHQILSAPTATFLVVCSKTLSLSISPAPGQGWCRGAIEVILRHANIVLAGHSHRTKSAHPKKYSTRFNLLLDHFPRCFMDFKKDLYK